MAERATPKKGERSEWNPAKFAVWSQRLVDPDDAQPTFVLLRHPTAPYKAVVTNLDDATMQRLAYDYLRRAVALRTIQPRLQLPDGWLASLDPRKKMKASPAEVAWLKIQWPPENFRRGDDTPVDPFASFRAERVSSLGIDQTVILMATEQVGGRVIGSDFGLRVVAHATAMGSQSGAKKSKTRAKAANSYDVRITGMSASFPFGRFQTRGILQAGWATRRDAGEFIRNLVEKDHGVRLAANLSNIKTRGLRIAEADNNTFYIERSGTGASLAPQQIPYSFQSVETVSQTGEPIEGAISIQKTELVAEAAGDARLFLPIDPASKKLRPENYRQRRPTRSEEELDAFREDYTIGGTRYITLQFGAPELARVTVSKRFVPEDRSATAGDPKVVDLLTPPKVYSNDMSAVSAYRNVKEVFDRLTAYGINPYAYFRLAKLPLKIAYRSGISPGPGKDGQTVNACVIPEGWPVDLVEPTTYGSLPSVEMHLALGQLSRRARRRWNGNDCSVVTPLGIATDARWIWHEMGHVLLVASSDILEFRFAHSAGDALAAIASDPPSRLADKSVAWRGITFPWVFLARRHDRCVTCGWSWGGTMHRALSLMPTTGLHRRKGYWSEQILSSSLFRLYRSLGGDTKIFGAANFDPNMRDPASHYTIYLIMRAMQIFGTKGVMFGNKPDDFVSALVDADIGTGAWGVAYGGSTFERTGGCAHKVARWAFEAQGLFTPAGEITNAPGQPPPVDVYIEDGRTPPESTPYGEIDYGPGNYRPVSLEWNPTPGSDPRRPEWQATDSAIAVAGNTIRVTVGNRGSQMASNVTVRVWFREWLNGQNPPPWQNGTGWTPATPTTSASKNIGSHQTRTFGPFTHIAPAKRYLILARATCLADPANTDTTTGLACSVLKTELRALVAGDNNLGLRVLKDP